jgi:hypothetical protein
MFCVEPVAALPKSEVTAVTATRVPRPVVFGKAAAAVNVMLRVFLLSQLLLSQRYVVPL